MNDTKIALCEKCQEAMRAVIANNDEHATASICYECASRHVHRPQFTLCSIVARKSDVAALQEGEELTDEQKGEISCIKCACDTEHNCISYGVQFPVTGGELLREDEIVVLSHADPVVMVVSGDNWLFTMNFDGLAVAHEQLAEIKADPLLFGRPEPVTRVTIATPSGEVLESCDL